jgi:hypothetical protein
VPVQDSEQVSRFVFRDYVKSDGVVKYGAFMPRTEDETEISVFRTSDVTEEEIRALGEWVRQAGGTPNSLKGRGDLTALEVRSAVLEVVEETATHELHANIAGFPTGVDLQRAKAQILANLARGTRYR